MHNKNYSEPSLIQSSKIQAPSSTRHPLREISRIGYGCEYKSDMLSIFYTVPSEFH